MYYKLISIKNTFILNNIFIIISSKKYIFNIQIRFIKTFKNDY